MRTKKIGDKGSTLNLSVASRAANLQIDKNYFKKHDEYLAKNKDEFIKYLFFGLLMLSGSIGLYYTNHYIWATIFLLFALLLLFVAYNVNIKVKGEVYTHGLLIPAIITHINPTRILALADVTDGIKPDLIWGFRYLEVQNLPNHTIQIGEKIPCVALFSIAIKGVRRYMEPHPLCWGTANATHIQQAIDAIDENEWTILEENKDKIKVEDDQDVITFFTENLEHYNPDTERATNVTTHTPEIVFADSNQEAAINNFAQQFVATYPDQKLNYSIKSIALVDTILDQYIVGGNLQAGNIQFIKNQLGSYILATLHKNFVGKYAITNDYGEPQTYFVGDGEDYFISMYPIEQINIKLQQKFEVNIFQTATKFANAITNATPGEIDMYI